MSFSVGTIVFNVLGLDCRSADDAGDLRHGEEHRTVAQGHPGQRAADEGRPDPAR